MVQAISVSGDPESGDSESSGQRTGSILSPAHALEALGDSWGLQIIRDALTSGTTQFSEFAKHLSIPADILRNRLTAFVESGLMVAVAENDGGPATENDTFLLTDKGRKLEPVVIALGAWSDEWASGDDDAVETDDSSTSPLLIEFFLLGSFYVRVDGELIDGLSVGSQRLLVFLALHDRAVARTTMAGTMWPEATDEKAGISLRSALSRLDGLGHDAVRSASAGLSLAATVSIDFRDAQALARRLTGYLADPAEADLGPAAVATLSAELLPDWYDDWVISEAEDWRQLRMSALEALAEILVTRSRLAEATGVARAAMKVEPLRESAHACLIKVHLAQGNQSEALRVYDRYAELLKNVLGLSPTEKLTELVADIQKG